jgi:hypothetical protein
MVSVIGKLIEGADLEKRVADAAARDRGCIVTAPGLSEQETNTVSDLTKYTQARAARDPEFAAPRSMGLIFEFNDRFLAAFGNVSISPP